MKKVNLLLVDDHRIFLDGLEMLLSANDSLHVSGTSTTVQTALQMLDNLKIDVVLTDLNMPEKDGLSFIKAALKNGSTAKFIALTMIGDSSTVLETLEAGADAYLLKNTSLNELVTAINAVISGGSYVSPAINTIMVNHLRSRSKKLPDLTKREFEVLEYVSNGLTSKSIAVRMNVSIDTVKFHRKNLLSKLNQPNTAALVNFALENQLVSTSNE